jgi:L-amino acid N-acyltransferase YncA
MERGLPDIRPMGASDWDAVRNIYLEGIATGNATFQTVAPSWEDWDRDHACACRLIAERDGMILGWAALAATSSRPVYCGVAEVSLYVARNAQGQGVGNALMARLVLDSEAAGFWTLVAGIFPQNEASLALHRRHDFREVGRRERIGKLGERWRDVVLMERRGRIVGWS